MWGVQQWGTTVGSVLTVVSVVTMVIVWTVTMGWVLPTHRSLPVFAKTVGQRLRSKPIQIAVLRGVAYVLAAIELLAAAIFSNRLSDVGDTCGPHLQHLLHGTALPRLPCLVSPEAIAWAVVAVVAILVLPGIAAWRELLLKRETANAEELQRDAALLKVEDFQAFGATAHMTLSTHLSLLRGHHLAAESERYTFEELIELGDGVCAAIETDLLPFTGLGRGEFKVDLMLALRSRSEVDRFASGTSRDLHNPYGPKKNARSDVGVDGLTDATAQWFLVLGCASDEVARTPIYLRVPDLTEQGKALPGAPRAAFLMVKALERGSTTPVEYDNIEDTYSIPEARYGEDASLSVRSAVEGHFKSNAQHVRSVFSLALGDAGTLVAVVNLVSARVGLLGDRRRQALLLGGLQTFAPLLEAVAVAILSTLAHARSDAAQGSESLDDQGELPDARSTA